MAKRIINLGKSPNSRDGDVLRVAFEKINGNFDELYTALGLDTDGLNLGAFEFTGSTLTTTDSTPIVIGQAATVTSNLTVDGDILPGAANNSDLGSAVKPWNALYVSDTGVYINNLLLGLNDAGNLTFNGNEIVISGSSDTFNNINGLSLDNSDATHGWTARIALPENGDIVNPISIQNNYGDFAVTTGVSPGNLKSWTFGADGNLILPDGGSINGSDYDVDITAGNDGVSTFGHISFTANGPNGLNSLTYNSLGEITVVTAGANDGLIKWVGNSSGDGAGYTTMVIVPDTTREGNDQYIIIDPTAGEPGHIHIRAGGTQDSSAADLYLGGEQTFVRVSDTYDSVAIRTSTVGEGITPHIWTFGTDGNLILPASGDILDSFGNSVLGGTGIDLSNVPQDILPDSNNTRDLGSPTRQWRDIYVSTGSIYVGNVKISNVDGTLQVDTIERQIDPETQEEIEVVLETESIQFTRTSHLELTNDPARIDYFIGNLVAFTKTDYGDEVDVIDEGLSITRGNAQGIYNPELEEGWDNSGGDPDGRESPKNTLWNIEGWADLTNLNARTYVPFYTAVGGNLGSNVLAPQFIMHDTVNDKYYKIDFTVWGNSNIGAPVTYTRQQVDGVTGDDIGGLVTFTKAGYADPFVYYDDIDSGLRISRASNQGIFNVALETEWNSNWPGDGDGRNSPAGTLWNLDGWSDLSDVKTRTYQSLYDAFNGNLGEQIVNTECVMKDVANDKYYAVKFSSWTQGANGGGFSYTRRQINPNIIFVHSTDGDEVDIIVLDDGEGSGIGITRGSDGAIYNPYREDSWDDTVSPSGTLWNLGGWDNLTDVTTRNYVTFYQVFGQGGIGNKVVGAELIMKVENDTYYKVKFLSWQQGGGGAFSYIRTLINTTGVLAEGIKFADGTVQKTAATNVVKYKTSGQRSVQEWYGDKTVEITEATSYTLDTTIWQSRVDSSYIYINVPSEVYQQEFINREVRNVSVSLDSGTTWTPVRVSGGGNYGLYYIYVEDPDYSPIFTVNNGDSVKVRYYRGGEPVIWFDPSRSPGGINNLRGAVIDYHAYSQDEGTIIGQIIISRDSDECNVTHSESTSGGSGLGTIDLWYCDDWNNLYPEGTLAAWRVNGNSDTIKIQWRATMFYGTEYWD